MSERIGKIACILVVLLFGAMLLAATKNAEQLFNAAYDATHNALSVNVVATAAGSSATKTYNLDQLTNKIFDTTHNALQVNVVAGGTPGGGTISTGTTPRLAYYATTGTTLSDTGANLTWTSPLLKGDRFSTNHGTALASGDFVFSGGWGSTAGISAISGEDAAFNFTMTAGGSGEGASPTVTLTFHDGTWTTIPEVVCGMKHASTGTKAQVTVDPTATTAVITYEGTASGTSTYIISCMAMGI